MWTVHDYVGSSDEFYAASPNRATNLPEFIHAVAPSGYPIFFFQAEDGIRDWSVTGAQTCALPICEAADLVGLCLAIHAPDSRPERLVATGFLDLLGDARLLEGLRGAVMHLGSVGDETQHDPRSEERRVGKECRCRW